MEDRYLFKAKRIDNGEWVQGALLFHNTDAVTIFDQHPSDGSLQGFEVDPSTICQCTGLKDKNGNLVWENDIVKYDWGGTRIDFIEYQPPIFTYSKSMRWNLQQDEVIGNIFDNPELLESEG